MKDTENSVTDGAHADQCSKSGLTLKQKKDISVKTSQSQMKLVVSLVSTAVSVLLLVLINSRWLCEMLMLGKAGRRVYGVYLNHTCKYSVS